MIVLSDRIDATILNPKATKAEFKQLCEDATRYQFPAVCVPPFMISFCRHALDKSETKVATVVGFPAGYQLISSKISELHDAISAGAEEIDYVIHRGYLAEKDWENIQEETLAWIDICRQNKVTTKWIIECSEVDHVSLDQLIKIANGVRPDYIKTSTGVYGQAILEQVVQIRKQLNPTIKIKAAGGINTLELANKFVQAGADRIGVSQYRGMVSSGN